MGDFVLDLPWGDERSKKFITNVGLITSDGPFGPDVMACEWTHHVSYHPGLIAVCIRPDDATHENIKRTGEFGINLCSTDQSRMSSIAGGYSGTKFDKIKALEELGFKFYKGKKIAAPMINGASVNIECVLSKEIPLGDHTTFIGEVVDALNNNDKEPLAYYGGNYFIMNTPVEKPTYEERDTLREIVEKYKK